MSPLRYLQLALVLTLLGAGGYFGFTYTRAVRAQANADRKAAIDRANALQSQIDVLSRETIRRSEFDAAIRDARASVSRNLDTATREDPVARDYLGERIPDSVRHAYGVDQTKR